MPFFGCERTKIPLLLFLLHNLFFELPSSTATRSQGGGRGHAGSGGSAGSGGGGRGRAFHLLQPPSPPSRSHMPSSAAPAAVHTLSRPRLPPHLRRPASAPSPCPPDSPLRSNRAGDQPRRYPETEMDRSEQGDDAAVEQDNGGLISGAIRAAVVNPADMAMVQMQADRGVVEGEGGTEILNRCRSSGRRRRWSKKMESPASSSASTPSAATGSGMPSPSAWAACVAGECGGRRRKLEEEVVKKKKEQGYFGHFTTKKGHGFIEGGY